MGCILNCCCFKAKKKNIETTEGSPIENYSFYNPNTYDHDYNKNKAADRPYSRFKDDAPREKENSQSNNKSK
jgi:hypothetical protein